MNVDLVQRIIAFISNETRSNRKRIGMDTTLFGDLGVDGEDGRELIEAFGKEFSVDISSFRPSEHFGPEGGGCLFAAVPYFLLTHVFRADHHSLAGLIPIRVSDLVTAAKTQRWPWGTGDRDGDPKTPGMPAVELNRSAVCENECPLDDWSPL
jgi:Protein of unknown function (DUF1493)